MYQFENICIKNEVIVLQDGVKKIIINVSGFENAKNKELKSFLKYMQTGKSNSEFTWRVEKMIETIKDKSTARNEYNFVPGYIMDAKYEQRELDQKEIYEAKAEAERLRAELKELKAELRALKNNS